MKGFLILMVAFFATLSLKGQVNDDSVRLEVLDKGIIDSMYTFGKWNKKTESTETHLKYLGQVTTKNGRVFKIMNSCWIWGISKRATNRLLVFNEKNKYVGEYVLNTINDLPAKLENGKLIFKISDCSKQKITVINLNKGLPKTIFLSCNGKDGDLYSFSNEE